METAMSDSAIEKLLALQEHDARLENLRRQIESIPLEIDGFEARIARERETVEKARQNLREMEVRRKELGGRAGAARGQIVKYKNQQLQVKKNEEYQALQHEIDALEDSISKIEDEELELMLAMDEARAGCARRERESEAAIKELKGHIARLKENEAAFRREMEAAGKAASDAASKVGKENLDLYQYVKGRLKKPPYVAPIRQGKCAGCHLRVSREVENGARAGKELHRCDSCGRIVYL